MKRYSCLLAMILVVCMGLLFPHTVYANEDINVTCKKKSIEVGEQIQLTCGVEGVSFKTSNQEIAYVSPDGVVTGKFAGSVTIQVTKEGYNKAEINLNVKEPSKKPNRIGVCFDEIRVQSASVNADTNELCVKVKNCSDETAKKLIYLYQITYIQTDETGNETTKTKTAKVTTENLKAGKSRTVKATIENLDGEVQQVELLRARVDSANTILRYDVKKKKLETKWASKDHEAPVISGLVGKDSYNWQNKSEPYMVVYSDKKYDYSKYVKAVDKQDGKVKLQVDTSAVNKKKAGTYTITFSAVDKAGNKAVATAKIQWRIPKQVDYMADDVLKRITNSQWSDQKNAKAIYKYVRQNYGYVDSNDHASWENSAVYGYRYGSGNCFVYHSVAKSLLTRLGIPNITITRYKGYGGHWWNLVYINGWYHFDTTPRQRAAVFCLLTDKQLTDYGRSHIFNPKLYPARATKKIEELKLNDKY